MNAKKRIAFIRPKAWPLANLMMAEEIKKQFHEYEVDVINIMSLVKKHPAIVIVNCLAVMLLYGREIIKGNKKFKDAFWRTEYIFRSVKGLIRRRLSRSKYLFTFQMQSLFDCSIPDVPHFVYTDHTHLANLSYAGFDTKRLYPQQWIDLEKKVYNNATSTFVRSSNIQRSLIEQYQYPAERAICVYAGSNVAVDGKTALYKSYTTKDILFVGIDWERKGGPELVDAFKLVLDQHPDAHLTIVGASPQIDLPNCTVTGRIPPKEVAQYYERATIFCLPTHVEPFGVAFLEAMQAHLPIIGTRVGAIPDFVNDGWNGFLVEPGDVKGIAEALTKLLDHPDQCREFGIRSLAIVNERYSWEAVGRKLHQYILNKLP